ncbi:MAG: flavin reductase [Bacilli bacterium]|nr:flavin reductase [Bacilli bacterium]
MHNEVLISDGLYYIGGSDRRLALFENVYPLENGASYNSYLYLDEKTLVLDTVDRAVSEVFYGNLDYLLGERKLDYLIVNHMEPDHAANIGELLLRHPETTIVINAMAKKFLLNYFPDIKANFLIVAEGDKLSIGKHEFTFVMAPMVHWPEVMMTYELTEQVLYSADAFGTFGALNGDIYASKRNFDLNEARRYYTNIVGKYGPQVLAVLKKALDIPIKMICPLHGPIHKGNLNPLLGAYGNWASYTPEDKDGIMIAYSSVYGDTALAAEILAKKIVERGLRDVVVYDVSKTDSSYLVSEAFRVGTILLCATTYNAGVFVKMEDFLHDLANHKIMNRTIGFVENGSWAPAAKANMKRILSDLEGIDYIESSLTIASALKESQLAGLEAIVEEVVSRLRPDEKKVEKEGSLLDMTAMFKLSYGLFALITKDGEQDNASINNSFFQVSDKPNLVMLSVNVANMSADTIRKTGVFNISVLNENADFGIFKSFGFVSGRDKNKFANYEGKTARAENGLLYLKGVANAMFSCKVIETKEAGNHVLFIAEVTEAHVLNDVPSMTYAYYFANVKPKPLPEIKRGDPNAPKKYGWRCKICGYTYVGDVLPEDYVCPLCKHPATDFEKVEL